MGVIRSKLSDDLFHKKLPREAKGSQCNQL